MKKQKNTDRKVELYTWFSFAYIANAQNVAMALAQSGYLVNIVSDGSGFRVDIYKWSY